MSSSENSRLESVSSRTIDHYESRAETFREGTADHDVSENIEALLSELGGAGPHRILDFGCGPGRDLAAFRDLGHRPVGLDGTSAFVEMAREQSGVEVIRQNFLALDLPAESFDGIFANASLFHVPSHELTRVLEDLRRALRPGGILFSSNPRGDNREGWNGERYCVYHDHEQWRGYALAAGFEEIRHYYRPPGVPRDQQPWLATLWRNT
ncbi:MAG: methyltransferase domain-containing protein [Myxococcota bacterium]